MDQKIRDKLRNVVTQCRKLLEDSISQELEGKYAIFAKKDQVTADPGAKMTHLNEEEQAARKDILDHYAHIKARGFKPKDALDQLIREIAFTHLNRLCAYKMMEAREVYVGGQRFREAVSRGVNSNGVKFYLAEHPEEERLFNTGHQDVVYRHFLDWLGGALSEEIGVLFNPNDPANRLYPRQKILDEVLDLLNGGGIKAEETELREQWPQIWSQDETIGWVYQYFTPKELRDQARKESQAPRNSYELAFRNQFFTPRYVVEFLTDNTLGRIWYEMRKGDTKLKDQCRYMVRRPTEIFLREGEQPPKDAAEVTDDLSQEELLKLPVHIPHRPKKDPRELKILDPACGSGHFLLYCFDLLLSIYEEAYTDSDLRPALKKDYPTLDALKRDVPRLILAHNLHGIDIDLRASQIAALALWLRCQRAFQEMGLKKERPQITRSNFVCAEPMPGEEHMLREFVGQLEPKVLGQVVEVVFDKMKTAGEAGSLLKIEEEIRETVAAAKKQYLRETTQATDRKGQPLLFTQATMDRLDGKQEQQSLFDLSDISDYQFFEQAETRAIEMLRSYAEKAQNGQRLQRQLFTDDTVRGFAFVDLCLKRHDVVIMNPPFGSPAKASSSSLSKQYGDSGSDLYSMFIARALSWITDEGLVGALTSRTGFFVTELESYRRNVLQGHKLIRTIADLGYGVLDAAVVETAAYCLGARPSFNSPCFIRLLADRDKTSALELTLSALQQGTIDSKRVHFTSTQQFATIPSLPLAYWLPKQLLHYFDRFQSTSEQGIVVKQGLGTADDFRFLRLAWEVSPDAIGDNLHWSRYAKGGEYAPVLDDIHLVVNWKDGGKEIIEFTDEMGNQRSRPRGAEFYHKPGLSYTMRTTSSFSPRIMPKGCIFSVSGHGIFAQDENCLLAYLGVAYTRTFRELLDVCMGGGDVSVAGSAARSYYPTVLHNIPLPPLSSLDMLPSLVRKWWGLAISEQLHDETHPLFLSLGLRSTETLNDYSKKLRNTSLSICSMILDVHDSIESEVEKRLEVSAEALAYLDEQQGKRHGLRGHSGELDERTLATLWEEEETKLADRIADRIGYSRFVVKKNYIASRKLELLAILLEEDPRVLASRLSELPASLSECSDAAQRVISYLFGSVMGRWDLAKALVCEKLIPDDPFSPLPSAAPGSLVFQPDMDYSSTKKHGIGADDDSLSDDVVGLVQKCIGEIWGESAYGIEMEACKALGVVSLRDYFRKSGKGGFWDDHISRHSKSRRKAPIYWLLQSSKKNYAVWLYYHRLDKDLLFKALVNYVEPKIRMETSRLESVRSQKAATGESGKEAKRLAREVERQEDFLSELRDFEDKLRRAANLHLEPDLNDGVVLNIAPLWELVPWKEAKKYWDELMEGKYEWSSIGKQLREKGLVQ